jgi:putative acetyltransferase
MIIRPEAPGDITHIRLILRAAFAGEQEADLVDGLRRDGDLLLSMVADDAGRLVGHVGFSRVWIQNARSRSPGASLAPLSVMPDRRRSGIGTALVEAGHARLQTAGESIVFVLGDLAYYGRFGYSVAAAAAFDCIYAGPHFQALALTSLAPSAGAISYAAAFDRPPSSD